MRIWQAIKWHARKHLLDYGIISGILCIVGAIFIPEVCRWLFELVHHSHKLTLWLGLAYGLVLVVIGLPMCFAIAWIFDRRK